MARGPGIGATAEDPGDSVTYVGEGVEPSNGLMCWRRKGDGVASGEPGILTVL